MNFILQRFSDNRKSTLGILFEVYQDDQGTRPIFRAYSLEDEFRSAKVPGETRIPAGTYTVDVQALETPMTKRYREKYPWFKNHLEIKNVANFKGVYLHVGNSDVDTDGCILLGDVASNNVIGDGSISNSTQAFKRFYESVYPNLPVTLIIRDEKELLK